MTIKKIALLLTLAGVMFSGTAFAEASDGGVDINPGSSVGIQGAGGAIEFTGEIADASCNVSFGNGNVDLGKWSKSYFDSQLESTKTPFTISVNTCPDSISKVSVLFDGDKDNNNSALLKVTDGNAGIGIKLYESDRSSVIPIGTVSKPVKIDSDSRTASLEFFADYVRDSSSAIHIGKANATSNFVMIYN
ncbi:fimbrial protein [Pantoea piersonii]|uniref:fimbrial protein n=1 Tax=Pantoea piersonii TaxID=2364647 RepID=UPI002FDAD62F